MFVIEDYGVSRSFDFLSVATDLRGLLAARVRKGRGPLIPCGGVFPSGEGFLLRGLQMPSDPLYCASTKLKPLSPKVSTLTLNTRNTGCSLFALGRKASLIPNQYYIPMLESV